MLHRHEQLCLSLEPTSRSQVWGQCSCNLGFMGFAGQPTWETSWASLQGICQAESIVIPSPQSPSKQLPRILHWPLSELSLFYHLLIPRKVTFPWHLHHHHYCHYYHNYYLESCANRHYFLYALFNLLFTTVLWGRQYFPIETEPLRS